MEASDWVAMSLGAFTLLASVALMILGVLALLLVGD